jgi:hypothetical protein
MPVLRYFVFVGAALMALLFVVGWGLPASPVVEAANLGTDLSTIRIHSDRKWPERVVFDTSAPTIVPAPTQTASAAPVAAAPQQVADASARTMARDAFAQLTPADLKKPDVKPVQKRKVAKRHVNPPPPVGQPTMLVAQRPQFGLFGLN